MINKNYRRLNYLAAVSMRCVRCVYCRNFRGAVRVPIDEWDEPYWCAVDGNLIRPKWVGCFFFDNPALVIA